MLQKKSTRPPQQFDPLAMARAALSVVFSQGRDDELAALRARVAELERSREDLCWLDRVQQVKDVC